MTSLAGKHVLLTGGSRGLGPVMAEALAARGAHLALAARSEEDLLRVADSLLKHGVQVITVPVDLAQAGEQKKLVSTVLERFGTIDILINNAGLETEGEYLELPWEAIQRTIDVNLVAPMALTYQVLPHMLKQKHGHIVNIASVAAKGGAPLAATYSGTKAGMAEWARALRLEMEGTGIRFSTLFPGYVTEVGMFARFHIMPPGTIGYCTPGQVARALIKAIEEEKIEIIINSSPARLLFVASEISPKLGDWLMHVLGPVDFQRKKVKQLAK